MNEIATTSQATTPATRPARGDLLRPINWLRSEIDRLFDDFGQPNRSAFNFATPAALAALEMVDGDKEYRLTAELPGLGDKDIDLQVVDGVLTLSGEKKEEQERKEKGYLLSERRYGSFQRQLSLPSDVDPNGIKAKFKDGVLTVTLPKDEKAAARTHKIAIEA